MKGVLRVMVLFYTSARIQPWLLGVGLAVFIASNSAPYAALCRRLSWSPMWTMPAYILSFSLVGAALALGSTGLRWISSRRLLTLIPFARVRLLLGLLLAPQLPAALIVITVVLRHHGVTRGWGSPGDTVEIVCSSTVLVTLWMFMASRSTLFGVLPAALGIALPALTRNAPTRGEIAGLPVADILGYAALTAVFIFAAWYLRAECIAPPKTRGLEGSRFAKIRPVKALTASKNAALDAFLLDAPSIWSAARSFLAMSAPFNILFLFLFGMFWYISDGRLGFTTTPLLTLITAATLGNQWVMKIAQRSRRIWLNSAETRLGVFHLCERVSWRFFAAVGTPIFLVCIIEWIMLPQGTAQLHGNRIGLYLLLVMLELNVCGLYFGLLAYRNRSGDQIPFVLVVMTVYLTVTVYLPFHPDAQLALPLEWCIALALPIGAVILRMAAMARWRDIDWLNCRPKRQAERAIPH
jgi:hypothetical protein